MTHILATPPECTRPSAARALMDEAGIAWRLHVRLDETATESLLLGSVADKVVHLGKVPTLIVC